MSVLDQPPQNLPGWRFRNRASKDDSTCKSLVGRDSGFHELVDSVRRHVLAGRDDVGLWAFFPVPEIYQLNDG